MQKFFPEKIYVLQSPNKAYLGLHKNNKPYIVGFSNKDSAKRVMKCVSVVKIQYESDIDTISLGKMYIIKSEFPHKCSVQEIDMNTFMDMPIKQNVGIVLGCEVTKDTYDEIEMSTVVVDPLYDIQAYRESMTM